MRRSHFLKRVLAPGASGITITLCLPTVIAACKPIKQAETTTLTEQSTAVEPPSKANGVWRVAIAPGARPFAMEKSGQLIGFDVDLIKAIAQVSGAELQLQAQPFDELIPALQSQQIDIAMGAIPLESHRSNSIAFSDPYFRSGIAIATLARNKKLNTLKALRDKNIAVVLNTTGAQLAIEIAGSRILTYDQSIEALKAVETGDADATLIALPALLNAINTKTISKLQRTGNLLETQDFGIAVYQKPSSTDGGEMSRLNAINRALSTLKREGKYNNIVERWL